MGGVAHILQSYVPEVPLPAILYVGTITICLVFWLAYLVKIVPKVVPSFYNVKMHASFLLHYQL